MRYLRLCLLILLGTPLLASGQFLELNGGYAHISGDGGLDGFNVGASLWVTHRISLGFDYDDTWDNSHLGVFELTQTGTIVSKSHLQDFLVGPRFYFPGLSLSKEKHISRLLPFAEVELGASHISSSLENPVAGTNQSASDNAFIHGWSAAVPITDFRHIGPVGLSSIFFVRTSQIPGRAERDSS